MSTTDAEVDGNVFFKELQTLYPKPRPNLSEAELTERYADKFLVAFVDILGFSSMIESDPKGERSIQIIEKAIKDAFVYANTIQRGDNVTEISYRIFSDNVCFWMPVKYHALSVSIMLSVLSEFQLGLIINGIFCRGGIAVGYHYASEYVLYGPALVEAVNLEDIAINPLITIPTSLIENFQLINVSHQFHQCHRLSYNEPWFVNYLSKIFYMEKEKSLNLIKFHRDVVVEKIQAFNDNPRVLEKYRWVASYHNNLVSMINFNNECAVI